MKKIKGLKIIEKTNDAFFGTYKKHDIQIEREDDCGFYIIVQNEDGCYSYDGYWSSCLPVEMSDAIEEALDGSCLLDKK